MTTVREGQLRRCRTTGKLYVILDSWESVHGRGVAIWYSPSSEPIGLWTTSTAKAMRDELVSDCPETGE